MAYFLDDSMAIFGGVHQSRARNVIKVEMSLGSKPVFFLSVFRKIYGLLFIRVCFCDQHFTISLYIGVVAIVNIDLQVSWLSFCLTRRIYIPLLSADCEIAVKAFVIIVCDLYCKDSSVTRRVSMC